MLAPGGGIDAAEGGAEAGVVQVDGDVPLRGDGCRQAEGLLRLPGIDFMKLHFGRNFFRTIVFPAIMDKLAPKTDNNAKNLAFSN
jgi:hypothetical protein